MGELLLDVKNLSVSFPTEDGLVKAVDDVSFTVSRGQTLGVVGESGSGKSVTFLSILGLVTRKHANISGQILFKGRDLLALSQEDLRAVQGDEIAMIFQDPLTALNPVHKVGSQITEMLHAHRDLSKEDAWEQAVGLLRRVGIPQPGDRARQYPHEFSGGMRQRAVIAMALALNPDLLIADEPTTALDVTVQAQILDLIDLLKQEFDMAVALITHDLGVVAGHASSLQVMYAGKIVERGDLNEIFGAAHHPYTWGLLESIPRADETGRLRPIKGQPPSLIFVPSGCSFHPRCPYRFEPCVTEVPELLTPDGWHFSACHLPPEEKERIFQEEVMARR